jgi:hypothetical protein
MPMPMPFDGCCFADLPSQSMMSSSSRPLLFLVMTDNDDDDDDDNDMVVVVVMMVCKDEWDSLWRFRSIVVVVPSSSSS